MSISTRLEDRCGGVCELCSSQPATNEYIVSPRSGEGIEDMVALCNECMSAIGVNDKALHWHCLEGSIWNPEPSVQVLSYRILQSYRDEDWANNIISSVELDEDVVQWAMSAFDVAEVHKDAFGNILEQGDTVVLIQALNVKGTNFTAAKGTVVKRIRLVQDNAEQIEGKINEQVIVILTKYVKKG